MGKGEQFLEKIHKTFDGQSADEIARRLKFRGGNRGMAGGVDDIAVTSYSFGYEDGSFATGLIMVAAYATYRGIKEVAKHLKNKKRIQESEQLIDDLNADAAEEMTDGNAIDK